MNTIPSLSLATLIAAGLLADAGRAQAQGGLLYATRMPETSTQCPSTPSALNQVTVQEVQYAAPPASGLYSSLAFATQNGYGELLGDYDGDGDYWESRLFEALSALMRPRTATGQLLPINMHSLFLSTGDNVLGTSGQLVSSGDVFRILPGGAIEHFLTEVQVQTAFGISSHVNVDAVALSIDPQVGGVFLSVEQATTAHMGPVDDGDILRIPAASITWRAGVDGCVLVQSVQSNSGEVFATEAQVDAMCANSGVAACYGGAVSAIDDLNGLAWNDQVGELWFCGDYTTGCAILTNAGGGQIAVLNGRSMGSLAPTPSSNTNVGLVHRCGSSLNALALAPGDLGSFATDTRTPVQPRSATIEAGGARGPVWFLLNLLPDVTGPGAADTAASWPNPCFPLLYPFLAHVGPVGAGCASFTANVPGTFPGFHITIQAVSVGPAGIILSTPSVIDL